jgi:hypothetical protein
MNSLKITNAKNIEFLVNSNNTMLELMVEMSKKITNLSVAFELNTTRMQELTRRVDRLLEIATSPVQKDANTSTDDLTPSVEQLKIEADSKIKQQNNLRSDIREFIYENTSYYIEYEEILLDFIMEKCDVNIPLQRVLAEIMNILYNRTEYHHSHTARIEVSIRDILSNYSFK